MDLCFSYFNIIKSFGVIWVNVVKITQFHEKQETFIQHIHIHDSWILYYIVFYCNIVYLRTFQHFSNFFKFSIY